MRWIMVLLLFPTIQTNSQENSYLNLLTNFKFLESNKGNVGSSQSVYVSYPNITEYLEQYGYQLQWHTVTTEDGYVITLHRIPAGRKNESSHAANTTKPAALFIHGLLSSGYDWVTLGPDRALGLLLADCGYDVWLLHTRGTRYSMTHKVLNSSDPSFWDFSFHEKGHYDVAASVDYILNKTSLQKLTLIGHSEGTTDAMVLAITRPEYNDKINLMVLLSPIAYMGGVKSPLIRWMVRNMNEIEHALIGLGIHGVPYSDVVAKLVLSICSNQFLNETCRTFIGIACGFDSEQLDMEYFMLFLSDKPGGASVKQLVHYGQEIKDETFRKYDYGTIINQLRYGSKSPPVYDPSKITAPVAAYYSQNDFFSSVPDVLKLLGKLPNIADDYLIKYEKFNHLDFISSKDVKTMLYDQVLKTINAFSNK